MSFKRAVPLNDVGTHALGGLNGLWVPRYDRNHEVARTDERCVRRRGHRHMGRAHRRTAHTGVMRQIRVGGATAQRCGAGQRCRNSEKALHSKR